MYEPALMKVHLRMGNLAKTYYDMIDREISLHGLPCDTSRNIQDFFELDEDVFIQVQDGLRETVKEYDTLVMVSKWIVEDVKNGYQLVQTT